MTYIDRLLFDVVAQRFDEADDLVRFVQNQTGKVDESIVTTYWLGKRTYDQRQGCSCCLYKI